MVYILPSTDHTARMRMFNADGSEAQMCGNALRCIGKYLDDRNELPDGIFSVETMQRIVAGRIIESGSRQSLVAIDMGVPVWEPSGIPVLSGKTSVIQEYLRIDETTEFSITCVSMGNPHCVIEVENVTGFPVTKYGPLIETNGIFPERINVGFMEKVDADTIELRVWERGTGETRACGSGACAAYAVWSRINGSTTPLKIRLPGGILDLSIDSKKQSIIQAGPATFVFEGVLSVD
jgi:diaminopimelate epimerase